MVRKQFYLLQAQDRKLKRLAVARGCTEAELIRDAVDQLPDPEGDVTARLQAAGLLAVLPYDENTPTPEELEALEAELDEWLDSLPEPLGLSEAILAEREESPY